MNYQLLNRINDQVFRVFNKQADQRSGKFNPDEDISRYRQEMFNYLGIDDDLISISDKMVWKYKQASIDDGMIYLYFFKINPNLNVYGSPDTVYENIKGAIRICLIYCCIGTRKCLRYLSCKNKTFDRVCTHCANLTGQLADCCHTGSLKELSSLLQGRLLSPIQIHNCLKYCKDIENRNLLIADPRYLPINFIESLNPEDEQQHCLLEHYLMCKLILEDGLNVINCQKNKRYTNY